MNTLYKKSEIWFAVTVIIVYVIGSGLAEQLSDTIGVPALVPLVFDLVLAAVFLCFVKKNELSMMYGLEKSPYPAKVFLYYLPLFPIAAVNVWFGVKLNMPVPTTLMTILSMLLVGFLEELIFRGFLFCAMAKDNVMSAVIVSSITFGIGHIVNLLRGAEIISCLLQLVYAAALGFLFVTLFRRGRSLYPCILTHGILNALSVFSNETLVVRYEIPVSAVLTVLALGYAYMLEKNFAKTVRR
ncbi:MAG: CPBP family intramembrane metalloprotease [Clostridia bacterium]|nr:CPBP family intramembrane metalloprotease [Clostridia bacterium]